MLYDLCEPHNKDNTSLAQSDGTDILVSLSKKNIDLNETPLNFCRILLFKTLNYIWVSLILIRALLHQNAGQHLNNYAQCNMLIIKFWPICIKVSVSCLTCVGETERSDSGIPGSPDNDSQSPDFGYPFQTAHSH